MLAFNMHFNIGFNLRTISTFCAAPRTIRLFESHVINLRVQIYKVVIFSKIVSLVSSLYVFYLCDFSMTDGLGKIADILDN